MTVSRYAERGLYFEEFQVGQHIISKGRTITEADIVNFAGLSGDYNLIHTDAAYAEGEMYGRRVAHGLLGLSIISGLAVRTGFMEGTVMNFREINEWKFSQPVFIGDTLHVEIEVEALKALPRLNGGAVTLGMKVLNQDDDAVMKGRWTVLVQSQSEES